MRVYAGSRLSTRQRPAQYRAAPSRLYRPRSWKRPVEITILSDINTEGDAALVQQIKAVASKSLHRFGEQPTRVEAHRGDQNSTFGRMGKRYLVRTWEPAWFRPARLICATFLCCTFVTFTAAAAQQSDGSENGPAPAKSPDGIRELPGRVEVQPVVKYDSIWQRISDIL